MCGGPAAICQDPDAQNAWEVNARRCHKTKAVQQYMNARKDDQHATALHVTARIVEARRKSARNH